MYSSHVFFRNLSAKLIILPSKKNTSTKDLLHSFLSFVLFPFFSICRLQPWGEPLPYTYLAFDVVDNRAVYQQMEFLDVNEWTVYMGEMEALKDRAQFIANLEGDTKAQECAWLQHFNNFIQQWGRRRVPFDIVLVANNRRRSTFGLPPLAFGHFVMDDSGRYIIT